MNAQSIQLVIPRGLPRGHSFFLKTGPLWVKIPALESRLSANSTTRLWCVKSNTWVLSDSSARISRQTLVRLSSNPIRISSTTKGIDSPLLRCCSRVARRRRGRADLESLHSSHQQVPRHYLDELQVGWACCSRPIHPEDLHKTLM